MMLEHGRHPQRETTAYFSQLSPALLTRAFFWLIIHRVVITGGQIVATERIIRDASIRLKLQPETKRRLEALSEMLGVPPSTLAAVWLGQAIAQHERGLGMFGKMAEAVGGEMGAAMRENLPEMLTLFGKQHTPPVSQ